MNFNFVDTDLICINDNLELQIITIPNTNHKILIIDNFLKNPEDLQQIASKQLFEKTPANKNGSPGWTSITNLKFDQITTTSKYLSDNYFDTFHNNKVSFQFNLFEGGMPCKYTSILPHVDQSLSAFQIYLNNPEDCYGGTNFYKHIESESDVNVEYLDSDFKKTESYHKFDNYVKETSQNNYSTILDSRQIDSSIWELIQHIEMKYNRFVMYPSYIFHSAYIEKEWYQDTKRIGLVGFLN
jgi:hypothetical protein